MSDLARVVGRMNAVQVRQLLQSLWWLEETIRHIPVPERSAHEQDTLLLAVLIRYRLEDHAVS
jgi:hypothetical protein